MKKLTAHIKKENGTYSIEAALIMLVVFFVLFFLITLSLILYEQTRVNAVAQGVAQRAALTYSVNGKDMATGKVDPTKFKEKSPYWRLLDIGTNDKKVLDVKNYAQVKLSKYAINQSEYKVDVTYDNYYIYKRVNVNIIGYYKVPFNGFLSTVIDAGKTDDNDKIFTSKGYKIEANAKGAINDQAEMVRTVDMIADILNQFETIHEFKEKYVSGINNIASSLS